MQNALNARAHKPGPKPMPREKCLASGCERVAQHSISGLCALHYARQKRNGHLNSSRRAPGSGTLTAHGYIAVAAGGKKKQAHVLVVERVLGKPLPPGVEVHHVNENKADNRPENLGACPDKAYHKLLHVRMAARDACGNPNYRKCPFCKEYGDPQNMQHNKSSRYFYTCTANRLTAST